MHELSPNHISEIQAALKGRLPESVNRTNLRRFSAALLRSERRAVGSVSRPSRVATNRVAVAASYTLPQANARRFLRIVSPASMQSQRMGQALHA